MVGLEPRALYERIKRGEFRILFPSAARRCAGLNLKSSNGWSGASIAVGRNQGELAIMKTSETCSEAKLDNTAVADKRAQWQGSKTGDNTPGEPSISLATTHP
jgi:hypothetical protein